ncbi:MAG: MBL fold metallo-hydrolase [Salinivirgaceae bacterium]|jgi:L-ascorbate metabolism protein UlaG (beta-lactamase superfamily)|nr:MBL fold metallo-hydrolase [Salinivirgaceae bacterium]
MKIAAIFTFITLSGFIWFNSGQNGGNKMDKMKASTNYKDGKFQNQEETPVMHPDTSYFSVMRQFMKKGENREPETALQTVKFDKDAFLAETDGIKSVWFGHSTVLLNINGLIVLTDPFFGERASPVSFMGTKKFDYTHNVAVADLPDIDIVLISHDHYDHLDKKTIMQINEKATSFIVPLGIESQLEKWKVGTDKIIELDWWQQFKVNAELIITMTPARHFSGRGLTRNKTLWCSYVVEANGQKVFFSGDSGYGEHFKEIGAKFGPFDLTLMECGQYNNSWAFIHMNPSETYKANADLGGHKMIPLHWGKFKLSLHSWTEPVELLIESSKGDTSIILTPKIGKVAQVTDSNAFDYWWR